MLFKLFIYVNTHLAGFCNIKKESKSSAGSISLCWNFLSQDYKLSVYIINPKKKVHQCVFGA